MIQALHDFHDSEFATNWADKFTPTPERLDLFETISREIEKIGKPHLQVLELGIGPGYLADYLLSKHHNITYCGFDYSEPMLKIAEDRLSQHRERTTFDQVDLLTQWHTRDISKPDVIVSTWALHDLFSKENIQHTYAESLQILNPGGVLLNGDFIKPENVSVTYEGGRILEKEHIALLTKVGFSKVTCIKQFEVDTENPTTANNYSCFLAHKP